MGNNFVENSNNLTDEEIINLINQGKVELLEVIIKRYTPVISFYAQKYCAEFQREDAVQEATYALYSAVRSYDSAKASFSTFADLCIKRSVLGVLKSSKRLKNIPDELMSSIDDIEVADSKTPEEILMNKESYKSLTDTIRLELSGMEYSVLQLFLSGKSYEDIADNLNISQKAVDNALSRIRKKLKVNKG